MKYILVLAASTLLVAQPAPRRQPVPRDSARSTAASANATATGLGRHYTPSTLVMIRNRARTFGDRSSASGTRYFFANDVDIAGKAPALQLERLNPPAIRENDAVRQMEVFIELLRPTTIESNSGQPIFLGTTIIEAPAARKIVVNSNIVATDLKIIAK
jgi:hypothetical protein